MVDKLGLVTEIFVLAGRHEPLSSSNSKGKLSSDSNGSNANELDTLDPNDPTALQMFDLGSMPGPSGLGGCGLDLYDNQEIMTNSSSLYDDSSNLPSAFHFFTLPLFNAK